MPSQLKDGVDVSLVELQVLIQRCHDWCTACYLCAAFAQMEKYISTVCIANLCS